MVPGVVGAASRARSRIALACVARSLREQTLGLEQEAEPFFGLAEDQGRAPPGEDLAAQHLAAQGLAVGLHHGQGPGVQLAGDVELVHGALPLPHEGQELKEEDAVLGVGGLLAYLLLELAQGLLQVALTQSVFG